MNWMTWVLLSVTLWISPGKSHPHKGDKTFKKLHECLIKERQHFVVPDKFNGVINTQNPWEHTAHCCIIFLQNGTIRQSHSEKQWLQMVTKDGAYLLHISKWHISKKLNLSIIQGRQCNDTPQHHQGSCQVTSLYTETICKQSTYDENNCINMGAQIKDKYIINITAPNKGCLNCNNPVKRPDKKIDLSTSVISDSWEREQVNPAQAVKVMNKISDLATSINVSSVELTVGNGIKGVLVRETEPEDIHEVSFGYASPNDSINIIDSSNNLGSFSRSITVPKEAFEKSVHLNVSVPFAAVLRFNNLATERTNSDVLGNEVLAIEMGTIIGNLTEKISINFRNMKHEGIPSCRSWNGEGSRPNWTDEGCLTIENGDNITCQCSHLTFFAVLLAPLNETTSSSDLNNLTIITQVGCGLSMFFLSIVLFMHFILRKTKASISTRILIHLVSAMFLLDFTFLINTFVANLKSSVGCKIMAALMHYFMLTTFTWFAVQAFHLCLQLYMGGKMVIRHYILKVSISSWALPGVVVIVLLIIGKYGEQVINTSDTEENVTMCWILDSDVHWIVNVGYYALVFLFTFTTFIIILCWLFCQKRTNAGNAENSRSGKSIVIILGLCCILGITWGFLFFAHGVLRIPAYYIFTVLNSFQGFFLFIFYYNTSQSGEINLDGSSHKNLKAGSTLTTCSTSLDGFNNPYDNLPGKK